MKKDYRLVLGAACLASFGIAGCGVGVGDDISSAAPVSATCNNTTFPDTLGYNALLTKYKNDGQCLPQVQNAEAMRQQAIANCSAGNATAAATAKSQYNTLVNYVKSIGCG
ncbi:hypothetical protein Q4S45_08265 [Massilia sp. R2A-15]|uniref:hypothetical protein n=1 Tax=Massilia sp. R2A-15 TaxID=3064278 RepID=UPI0027348260|nr:hypothetical protein [Massilia sp. R2A-15]WLI91099.1 hypothetical protein Q4S45_08265 [Massilia sp. R2A-15]